MKLYIFTPNRSALFTPELEAELERNFDVTFYTEIKPLEDHGEFLIDESEKIVALDPDFFDWSFKQDKIDMMKNVKAICLQTTSFSWIDSEYAQSKGIPVLNLRGFSQEAVAEYALFLAFGVARKIALVAQNNYVQDFVAHQGIELKGRTAGVIGLGRIGSSIASLCKGVGMNVQYWSRSTKNDSYQYASIEELLKTSDVVFVSLASNDETIKILTDDLLKTMKSDAIFVSIAHKIYNRDLIIEMVQTNKLYGYGCERDNGSPTMHRVGTS
jgi:lactate dehydrogenase-like 2-hydroxyacid dehydrogenase